VQRGATTLRERARREVARACCVCRRSRTWEQLGRNGKETSRLHRIKSANREADAPPFAPRPLFDTAVDAIVSHVRRLVGEPEARPTLSRSGAGLPTG